MAASSALKNSCAMHHPTTTTGTFGASATTRMPRDPPARPITIQGRRIPHRDEVRSLILPKNGLPTIATRAPTPATTARFAGASSIPTSELTFNAKVTSTGARNTRQVPMYAAVYRAMKPRPTRCAAAGRGSSEAPDEETSGIRPPRGTAPSRPVDENPTLLRAGDGADSGSRHRAGRAGPAVGLGREPAQPM
jgi:hypothetical protein